MWKILLRTNKPYIMGVENVPMLKIEDSILATILWQKLDRIYPSQIYYFDLSDLI